MSEDTTPNWCEGHGAPAYQTRPYVLGHYKINEDADRYEEIVLNLCRICFNERAMDDPKTAAWVDPKIGRNALCPCSSGKKYKKCCGRNR